MLWSDRYTVGVNEIRQSFWSRLQSFFRPHLGEQPGGADLTGQRLNELLGPIDHLRHQALNSQDALKLTAEAGVHEASPLAARLRAELLECHRLLATGMNQLELDAIGQGLSAHCKHFKAPHPDELSEFVVLAVLQRLHEESLRLGLADFESRVAKAQLQWPVPGGTSPHASHDELEHARRLDLVAWRQSFLEGPLARFSRLISGDVPSWGDVYPEPTGAVWRKTIYEAVAAALAGRYFFAMEGKAHELQAELDRVLAQELPGRLDPLRMKLEAGVSSIAEARNLSDQAVEVCQQLASAKVWELLQGGKSL